MQAPRTIDLMGMKVDVLDSAGVLDTMFGALEQGRGGWIVTANLDILRRFVVEPSVRPLYSAAEVRVADGMPLVWASALQGEALPERVAGSSLAWLIAREAAEKGRTLYLLGGDEGAAEGAAATLRERFPAIRILGHSSPWVSKPATREEVDGIVAAIGETSPDIIFIAFGSPKQEYVAQALRERFPGAWLIGIGISLGFMAGQVHRAPVWMQQSGLEWVHRMFQEPERLVRRYLVEDLPFAAQLFATSAVRGFLGRRR